MRLISTGSTARLGRLIPIVLTLPLAFCVGSRVLRTTAEDPARIDIGQLWLEPTDLESRDLFHGPGGPSLAPDPSAPYELVEVDDSGYSPGYDVRDPEGTEWSVKLGIEAQPELVTSRILWAIGYHQPPTYFLARWRLTGKESGTREGGRFRREFRDHEIVSDWSWYQNPFVTTQPFRGLVVANLILNNWDWKTSNNKLYERRDGIGPRRLYVVRDLGASLGKTTFPAFLKWTPVRGMGQGTRNDLEGFEEQGFIKRINRDRVVFDYRGIHAPLVNSVTVDDVVWTCRLMARLSDEQWQDAFRAAGYGDVQRQRYIAKLKSKVSEGLALAQAGTCETAAACQGSD